MRRLVIVAAALLAVVYLGAYWVQADSEEPALDAGRKVTVEVWNGTGWPGDAGWMADRLQAKGFDVYDTGNAPRFDYPETIVIDRRGRGDGPAEVARALGCANVILAAREGTLVDVTVIVGRDGRAKP